LTLNLFNDILLFHSQQRRAARAVTSYKQSKYKQSKIAEVARQMLFSYAWRSAIRSARMAATQEFRNITAASSVTHSSSGVLALLQADG
jgi:hypothetical protein